MLKYTRDMVVSELHYLLDYLEKDGEGVQVRLVNELTKHKPYGSSMLSQWVEEFKEDAEICNLYDKLSDLLITRINDAVSDRHRPMDKTIAGMALRTYYGWNERKDGESKNVVVVNLPEYLKGV